MAHKKTWMLETELFGKHVKFPYAEHWVGYSLFFMRVTMGWILLQGGISKVLDPTWTASGYLQNAIPAGNPLTSWFASMAGNPVVDWLVVWGLVLTGIGVMFGALTRFNAFWASIMMFLFYLASLQGGLFAFLPLQHGFVIDEHIIYIAILWGVSTFGAGQILGVDGWLRKNDYVKKHPWLNSILG